MKIKGFIWYHAVIDKLLRKHAVTREEVEEVFANHPKFTRMEKVRVKDEHLYSARGRTVAGRYIVVLFIYKKSQEALIVTAREMDDQERRSYGKK